MSEGSAPDTEEGVLDDAKQPTPADTTTEDAVSSPTLTEKTTGALHAFFSTIAKICGDHKTPATIALVAVLLAVLLGTLLTGPKDDMPAWMSYGGSYRLVPETVSQSATIAITAPKDAGTVHPTQVAFEPEIRGEFVLSEDEEVLLFKPELLPVVGARYNVALSYGSTTIGSEFQVAEDPKIVSVLPSNDAEVHEKTKISVIFNRPMVPLTTREELDKQQVPVRLHPDVPGKWKWKSTRLLQFVPDVDLNKATVYQVTVNEGFRSLDGVAVPGFSHSFTTRTLKQVRYSNEVRFNKPFEVVFNQPVNLERTAGEVTLKQNGKNIEAIVQYAKKPPEGKKMFGLVLYGADDEVDKTRLWIQPIKDKHGREGYWDFKTNYQVKIAKKYPIEGDVVDTTPLEASFTLGYVLNSLTVQSERSSHVTPTFFDPQGTLIAIFHEPVDIHKSQISIQGKRDVRYGKQCRKDDEGNTITDPQTRNCEEEDNKHELHITVNPQAYEPNETTMLSFDRVVHEDGMLLNTEPIVRSIHSIPAFEILNTFPKNGDKKAGLTNLVVCSNTPLKAPEPGTIRDVIQTTGYVVYPNSSWRNSFKVQRMSSYTKCQMGQFETVVRYGLHPQAEYGMTLRLEDQFAQKNERQLNFTSAPAPSEYTRFFSLQKRYNVTVPGKTRLTFGVENLPDVTAHICKVSPSTMLTTLETNSLYTSSLPNASLCETTQTNTLDLPDTYWVNNYFYFDLKDYLADTRGHYIITFTHPNYRDSKGSQQYAHALLSVSLLTAAEKRVVWPRYSQNSENDRRPTPQTQNLYWVLDALTLTPVPGARVVSYEGDKTYGFDDTITSGEAATTNAEGVARIPSKENATGATIERGTDTAIVSAYTDTLQRRWGRGGESLTYIYTDRPIYKPGDSVQIRGIDRVGYDHDWQVAEDYDAEVQVLNSRRDVIYKQTIPVSKYGTFNTTVQIPSDAPLGRYTIKAFENSGWFDVEEYVGAPFKVTVASQDEEYVAGDSAQFTIDAQYYFDMPVSDATVEYSVMAQDYHFDRHEDEYFNFGRGWYSCYWCGYGDQFITRGTLNLDKDGKGVIDLPLDFKKHFAEPDEEGSKLFTVVARVTEQSGRQVSAQNSTIVHRGDFYMGVKTNPYFTGLNQPVSLKVKTVDTQGEPIGIRGIDLTVTKVAWKGYQRREVDGGYYWHSEEERTVVSSKQITTNNNGDYEVEQAFAEPGSYEVATKHTDARGNVISSKARMYIYGGGHVSVRPTNNEALSLSTDKASYIPGEQASILIESPFESAAALVTVERGDIYQYWSKKVDSSLVTQSIPMRATYAPNVYASVLLVGPGPEVKYGSTELRTDIDTYELDVEVTTNKDSYLPGEDVVLHVSTTNALGSPVSAEVSVAIVDMSVLALKGNPKKDPVSFFYGSLPLAVSTSHSAKNMLVQNDIPTGTKGGGGGDPNDLEKRKRGVFKDTAYWQANVVTDESGKATITFQLPDNLTTWQIESLGVTPSTLLGVNYKEFTSKKSVMAIPLKPRFVIPGDTTWLGMQIANNTDKDLTLRARIESSTLTVFNTEERKVKVRKGEQKVVYFETKAPRDMEYGSHNATFYAIHDDYEDVVEQTIPILQDKTFEVTATAGMSTRAFLSESVYIPDYALPNQGELTVRAQPTLVASLLDAVRDISAYPYGCSEQIASKLASLATVRRASTLFGEEHLGNINQVVFKNETYDVDEVIRKGIADLLGRQSYNGGFPFYQGSPTSAYLTVEVLIALTVLRDAGYEIPNDVFKRASTFIRMQLARDTTYANNKDFLARVAFALSSPYVPVEIRRIVVSNVDNILQTAVTFERLSTTALGYLTLATLQEPYSQKTHNAFYAALENRLVIDARGAYVKSHPLAGHSWFESTEKNTALFLRAVAERGGEHAFLDSTLRWLRTSKQANGGWGSTNATFTVLDASLRLVEARKENKASYVLNLIKDNEQVATHTVLNATLFDEFTYVFPIDSFAREKLEQVALQKAQDKSNGTVYYDMQLRYALPPDMVPPRDEGITVERALYTEGGDEPVIEAKVGDIVTGKLEITIPAIYHAVSIESFVPAGFEIVNFKLATEIELGQQDQNAQKGLVYDAVYPPDGNTVSALRPFPVTYQELHNDRVFVFTEQVRPGTYSYEYTLRALIPGEYRHMPATVKEMYTPEVYGRTSGGTFVITED